MKMDQSNPGGMEVNQRSMKGCEKYQAEGKGNVLQGGYLQTKFSAKARGMEGMVPAGKARGK